MKARWLRPALVAAMATSGGALSAAANPAADYSVAFERPYGFGYGQEDTPYEAGTRDANGNRVIVNGRMFVGDDLSTLPNGMWNLNGLTDGAGFATGTAIGNQLNVITQGSWNTVVVTNEQINYGDITANTYGNASTGAGGNGAVGGQSGTQFGSATRASDLDTNMDTNGLVLNGELNLND